MKSLSTFRCILKPVVATLLLPGLASGMIMAQTALAGHSATTQAHPAPKPQNQEHLTEWMDRHGKMPLVQQQHALQSEPGFHDLPAQTQQRMLNHLSKLNNMPPEQRRRMLEHNEALEHLSLPQRQQVRGAMQQLGGLPVDRRRLVARAFRDLREMPETQRQGILNSDHFRGQFSDQERSTLSNLLTVEPYLPVQRASDNPEFGK